MITVEESFKAIMRQCNPHYGLGGFADLFDMFFGRGASVHNSNFVGGCGDTRRTQHERVFALLYPNLKQQVAFGTGKGGYGIYGAKRYIVDFYHEPSKRAYEIDGDNHKRKYDSIVDLLKAACLKEVYGITVVRFTNKQVEIMLRDRLQEISDSGRINELFEKTA